VQRTELNALNFVLREEKRTHADLTSTATSLKDRSIEKETIVCFCDHFVVLTNKEANLSRTTTGYFLLQSELGIWPPIVLS
jgi:hypothetical protein